MNWDHLEGHWKQLQGQAREHWGLLTEDELELRAGRRDRAAGTLQLQRADAKDQAQRQRADWEHRTDVGWLATAETLPIAKSE